MQQKVPLYIFLGIVSCLLTILVCSPVLGDSNETDIAGYVFKVQEDPYFTFGYPDGMTMDITSDNGRNTYRLMTVKQPPVIMVVTSEENSDWNVLSENASASLEESMRNTFLQNVSKNLTAGEKTYTSDDNQSSYFVSYLNPDSKELIYSYLTSSADDVIYAMVSEPAGLYQTEFGNFTLKSLLSVTPRTPEKGLSYQLAGNDKNLAEQLMNTTNAPTTKDFVYDPYVGLFMDTDTGYYYIPQYGVFFDPVTGNIYYPSEFGNYDENFFQDYAGLYTPTGTGTSGYYDGLYSGYSGTSGYTGYDASDIINDAYQNRQNVYDAANAQWSDYIRDNQYYAVDDSGYAEPIDTIQEYQDYGLS